MSERKPIETVTVGDFTMCPVSAVRELETYTAELEKNLDIAIEVIKRALSIEPLWVPDTVDVEHEDEAKALHSMRTEFLTFLKQIKGV